MITALIIICLIIIGIYIVTSFCCSMLWDDSSIFKGILVLLAIILLVVCIFEKCETYEDKHTDNETRIIKENDEPKELYVTIDCKEYHFKVEEEKK